jgi:hypothetical protein
VSKGGEETGRDGQYPLLRVEMMTKEKLVAIIRGLFETEIDLDFLFRLRVKELELLAACVRDRLDQTGK